VLCSIAAGFAIELTARVACRH